MTYHKPVMLEECLAHLNIQADGTYVDVTFGGGGHSRGILAQLGTQGRLVAFDQDPDARKNLPDDSRLLFIASNFRHLLPLLRMHGIGKVHGILADFGVSSHQLDQAERGFSLRFDGPLDMRMNPEKSLTAAQVLNEYSAQELINILRKYAELPRPNRLVQSLIAARPLQSTAALKSVLESQAPRQNAHRFYARVFQALRLEVNQELDAIEAFLLQLPDGLEVGGRVVCLSYHSLEDRLVKNFFRSGNTEGEMHKDFYGKLLRPLEPLLRKPLYPAEAEQNNNPRARSARLRVAERIAENV